MKSKWRPINKYINRNWMFDVGPTLWCWPNPLMLAQPLLDVGPTLQSFSMMLTQHFPDLCHVIKRICHKFFAVIVTYIVAKISVFKFSLIDLLCSCWLWFEQLQVGWANIGWANIGLGQHPWTPVWLLYYYIFPFSAAYPLKQMPDSDDFKGLDARF